MLIHTNRTLYAENYVMNTLSIPRRLLFAQLKLGIMSLEIDSILYDKPKPIKTIIMTQVESGHYVYIKR